ncbi:MAG TPA: hypothetical protein DDZ92_04000 [Halomonas sp.]|nr:hypothetical protein [Halomonas sp.]|tara:strand:+ start:1748 stop:2167 length:420 start_codon:yes stop_codon:yes gene_type:complete
MSGGKRRRNQPAKANQQGNAQPSLTQVTRVESSWSGPLPRPEQVEHFEAILPGAAQRIFDMAEREQGNRITVENQQVSEAISFAKRGQYMGFGLAAACIAAGTYLAAIGQTWPAVVLLGGSLGTVVAAFFRSKATGKAE